MKKELAVDILNNLKQYKGNYDSRVLNRYEYEGKFHQWVDGKDILGIVNISSENTSYYLIFIDWRMSNDNYYIVVLSKDKANVLLEIHKVNEEYNSMSLEWRYKPSKRDGINEERKECFKKYYGDIIARIQVPSNIDEIEGFLVDIFELTDKRIKSDNVIFREELIIGFPEGRVYERVHKKRERNGKLIRLVKEERLKKDKKLVCEICKFDFYKVYKDLGKGFIEAHHTIPVSQLKEDSETKKEDIALVCSNCHSMLHRKRPWMTIDQMKKIVGIDNEMSD